MQEKLTATFTLEDGSVATYTAAMPKPGYAGYGSGIFSELRLDAEGCEPEYFDERYNRSLYKSMTLADFKTYVQENILPRLKGVQAGSLRVARVEA